MSMNDFINNFAEVIEVDANQIDKKTLFKNHINWDSIGALTLISMIDEVYQISIRGCDIEKSETIEDLWDIVKERLDK
jgi:acyl carrier protein